MGQASDTRGIGQIEPALTLVGQVECPCSPQESTGLLAGLPINFISPAKLTHHDQVVIYEATAVILHPLRKGRLRLWCVGFRGRGFWHRLLLFAV